MVHMGGMACGQVYAATPYSYVLYRDPLVYTISWVTDRPRFKSPEWSSAPCGRGVNVVSAFRLDRAEQLSRGRSGGRQRDGSDLSRGWRNGGALRHDSRVARQCLAHRRNPPARRRWQQTQGGLGGDALVVVDAGTGINAPTTRRLADGRAKPARALAISTPLRGQTLRHAGRSAVSTRSRPSHFGSYQWRP